MSRLNRYTSGFIEMSGRELDGWTRAFVRVAIKAELTVSDRKTLGYFERIWESGSDLTENRTYDLFLALCRRYHVPIQFMRKHPDTGRKGEKGGMVLTEWTTPEPNGSHWPPLKDKNGVKRTNEQMRAMKRERRIRVKLQEMARLGVASLTFGTDQIEAMIERKVIEQVREIEPMVSTPQPVPVEVAPVQSLAQTYEDAYEIAPLLRLIQGGKAA